MRTLIIGVDPGATTGVCALPFCDECPPELPHRLTPAILQCPHADAVELISNILTEHSERYRLVLAIEQFVTGPRAGKSATAIAGRLTRELITELTMVHDEALYIRPAALVKPWATDRRLAAAGLIGPTRGLPHARDAARHALFCAVKAGITRDPLSVKIEC